MKMRTTTIAMLFVGTLFVQAAYASAWYVGVEGASNQASFNDSDAKTAAAQLQSYGYTTSLKKDESSSSVNLLIGYDLNPHFALEAGHMDFGKTKVSLNYSGSGFAGQENLKLTADGLDFALVGKMPIGHRITVFGKAGFVSWSATGKFNSSDSLGISSSSSKTASGTSVCYGIGANVALGRHVGLRVEGTVVPSVGDNNTTGKEDMTQLSVGVTYHF